jgi:hypothetical protein
MSEEQPKDPEAKPDPAPVDRVVMPRIHECDPDYRRDPKTDYYCWHCNRDLKQGRGHSVLVVEEVAGLLHPEDKNQTVSVECKMGSECVKSQNVPREFLISE